MWMSMVRPSVEWPTRPTPCCSGPPQGARLPRKGMRIQRLVVFRSSLVPWPSGFRVEVRTSVLYWCAIACCRGGVSCASSVMDPLEY